VQPSRIVTEQILIPVDNAACIVRQRLDQIVPSGSLLERDFGIIDRFGEHGRIGVVEGAGCLDNGA